MATLPPRMPAPYIPGTPRGMERFIPLEERPVIDMRPKGVKPYDPSVMRKRAVRIPGTPPPPPSPAGSIPGTARALPPSRGLPSVPAGFSAQAAQTGGATKASTKAVEEATKDVSKTGIFGKLLKTGIPLAMLAWMWSDILGKPKAEAEGLFQRSTERGMGWQQLVDLEGMELSGIRDQLALVDQISQLPSADDGQFARMLQESLPVMRMAAMAANQMPEPVAPDMSTQLAMQQGVIG